MLVRFFPRLDGLISVLSVSYFADQLFFFCVVIELQLQINMYINFHFHVITYYNQLTMNISMLLLKLTRDKFAISENTDPPAIFELFWLRFIEKLPELIKICGNLINLRMNLNDSSMFHPNIYKSAINLTLNTMCVLYVCSKVWFAYLCDENGIKTKP